MVGLSNPETDFQGRSLLILLEDEHYMNQSITVGVWCAKRHKRLQRISLWGHILLLWVIALWAVPFAITP
jgi:hypothetical protein